MRKFLLFFFLIIMPCFSVPQVFLQITKDFTQKAEVVLLFQIEKNDYWENFANTLSKDLFYSGYFNIKSENFVEDIEEAKQDFPVNIIISVKSEKGNIVVSVFDNLEEQELFRKNYNILKDPFYFAHVVNDDIVLFLTGKPGIAKSRVIFVANKTGKYQIYVCDYDGRNLKQITNFNFLVNFPVWTGDRSGFYFVSYKNNYPEIAKYDFNTGKEETIFQYPGLNACVAPCKQKNILGVVLSKSGNPEIYLATIDGKIIRRLTDYKGVDSSPSFSPDGEKIVFVSDRYGTPQIFIMDSDGFGVKRISYGYSYSTSPKWSPDGNYIAYVVRSGDYKIAIFDVKTNKTKILSNSSGSETISWASDSRHIVFSKVNMYPSKICIIDVFTGETRDLTNFKYDTFSPDWEKF